MTLHDFVGVGRLDLFLVPVSSAYGWDPAELWRAAQCSRWVSVKRPHAECGFRLTCGLKKLLLYVEGEGA
jgi:hypothetical protein